MSAQPATEAELLAMVKHLLHACETPGDFTPTELIEMMGDAAGLIERADDCQ